MEAKLLRTHEEIEEHELEIFLRRVPPKFLGICTKSIKQSWN